ncbi:hypothetical protein Syun_014879 [Stephania yunnanensis]|uniref:Uncharacterized protein n=1 Tax=Stephania yunnanensis TaxID=152371 RepID=A0AAP0PA12_9MAGN
MRANVGFHEIEFYVLPQRTVTNTTVKRMRAIDEYNDSKDERELKEIRRFRVRNRTTRQRTHSRTSYEARQAASLMAQLNFSKAEGGSASPAKAKRKRFFKSLSSALMRNEKQILRNHDMLDENKRTLACHHSMSERRVVEHSLIPRRNIDIPSLQLRFPSGVCNPANSYTSQPTTLSIM